VRRPITAGAAILVALGDGPKFGRQIANDIESATGGQIILQDGSKTPAVLRLLEEGLIERCDGPQVHGGGRARRYLRLTDAGRVKLEQHRSAMAALYGLAPAVGWVDGLPEGPGIYWLLGQTRDGLPAISLFRVSQESPEGSDPAPFKGCGTLAEIDAAMVDYEGALELVWTRIDIISCRPSRSAPWYVRAHQRVDRPPFPGGEGVAGG